MSVISHKDNQSTSRIKRRDRGLNSYALRKTLSKEISYKNYALFLKLGLTGVLASLLMASCAVGPEPIKVGERQQALGKAVGVLETTPRPVKAVSLSEAIARAIRFNLATRVQAYQAVIENTQVDLANLAMLPDILTNSGYRFRDPAYASFGPGSNGQPNYAANPTIAEQRQRRLQDLTFNWNVLDLGLSYFRAQQQADRAIIAIEAERRARHQIVQDTIIAWYRAETERKIRTKLEPLLIRVHHAMQLSKENERSRLQEPIEALSYQRDILETIQNLDYWKKDLAGSEYTFTTMLGLKSDNNVITGEADFNVTSAHLKRGKLQAAALDQRPDVQTSLYESRMSKRDAIMALMELLPVPTFTVGNNYDSNKFLAYNEWFSLGSQMGLNLVKLARVPTVNTLNQEKIEMARQKVVAVVSAALVQIDIALAQLDQWEKIEATSRENKEVSDRIVKQVKAAEIAKQASESQLVREELRSFVAEIRYDIARNEEKAAAARLMASTGIDFASADGASIEETAKQIRHSVNEFNSGKGTEIDLVQEEISSNDLSKFRTSSKNDYKNVPPISLPSGDNSKWISQVGPIRGSAQ